VWITIYPSATRWRGYAHIATVIHISCQFIHQLTVNAGENPSASYPQAEFSVDNLSTFCVDKSCVGMHIFLIVTVSLSKEKSFAAIVDFAAKIIHTFFALWKCG